MKVSSIFKYIFIIFAIGIIIAAGYKIYSSQNQVAEENNEEAQADETILKDIRIAITNYDNIYPLITNNKEILNIDSLIFEP